MLSVIKYSSLILAVVVAGLTVRSLGLSVEGSGPSKEPSVGRDSRAVAAVRWASDAAVTRDKGTTLLDGVPFSGMLLSQDESGIFTFTLFSEGRKEGLEWGAYPGGQVAYERQWSGGKREGTFVSRWEDGSFKQMSEYSADLLEGPASEWFRGGQLARSFTYVSGQEEGPQRMWFEDGSIRANYHVKDGRRYGSIGTKGCGTEGEDDV
jgi:hypothetical protein